VRRSSVSCSAPSSSTRTLTSTGRSRSFFCHEIVGRGTPLARHCSDADAPSSTDWSAGRSTIRGRAAQTHSDQQQFFCRTTLCGVCPSLSCIVLNEETFLKLISPSGRSVVPVFRHQTLWQFSDWDPHPPPYWGRRTQVGIQKMAIFDQYLALSRKRYKIGP